MKRMIAILVTAITMTAMASPAQAGGILDILSGKNRNSGTLIRELSQSYQTRVRERERTRQEQIRNQAYVEREQIRLERDVGVEKLRSQTDVRRAELRLEERKLQLQAELAKTRSKYRAKRLDAQIKAIDAALNSVRKRGVQIRLAERNGQTATVHVAGNPEPVASRSRYSRYYGSRRMASRSARTGASTRTAAASAPALSVQDLEVLRKSHRLGRTYSPAEAKIRGYVVYSNGKLAKLTAVEIGSGTRYWVMAEHVRVPAAPKTK